MVHVTRPKTIPCPCCKQDRDVREDRLPLSAEAILEHHGQTPWWAEPGWTLSCEKPFFWACEECLGRGRAIPGDPSRQRYSTRPPRLAYFDLELRCSLCSTEFLLTKEAQQWGYETAQFWVQAETNKCPLCREARRSISQAIAQLDPKDAGQLLRIGRFLKQLRRRAKAIEYLRRARNVATVPAELAEIDDELRQLTQDPQSSDHQGVP